jgi:squalene synthase HpnC
MTPPASARPPTTGPAGVRESTDDQLYAKRRAENFPVALRVLPSRLRAHLTAVYDVVRVIDDLGDEAPGDRAALLTGFAADLAGIWRGEPPRAAVLRQLVPTVRACELEPEPFARLIEANLRDQRVDRYATFEELLGYCRLSADPVGRIVLAIFGAGTPRTVALSDRVCTALQLIEHWQDVAEDRRAGRIYLPRADLVAFGVTERDLDRPVASAALRRLVEFEAARAGRWLDSGAPLVGLLHGWARLAVAGYVAGGRAAIDALRRARWDVLSQHPRVRKRDVVRHLARLWWGRAAA